MRLEYDPNAWEDLLFWKKTDKKKLARIMLLLASVERTPFVGIGKPEPLKYELSGCWSRRIDRVHRLVYKVSSDAITVISCRYHY
ncbi:MAG: Txe/YoeB family addiction module toxin [bacterium]|nr:Txe/YoeB family addiction module toxin [bacterium]